MKRKYNFSYMVSARSTSENIKARDYSRKKIDFYPIVKARKKENKSSFYDREEVRKVGRLSLIVL
jgi:hypothetical protein